MPLHPWQSNFTTGEVSDLLDARTDWQKYSAAAKCLGNFVVRTHGGISRRAGLVYLGSVKSPADPVRLVKFEFNIEQAYVLEFGPLYIRVWANRALVLDGGGVPVEIVTPYVAEDLMALRFDQSADVMYIAHVNYPPAKFQRTAANVFTLDTIIFVPRPTMVLPVGTPQPITGPVTVTGAPVIGGTMTATVPVGCDFGYLAGELTAHGGVPIRFCNGSAQSIIAVDAGATTLTILLHGAMPAPADGHRYNTGTGGTLPAFIPGGSFAYDDATGTYTFPAASVTVETFVWQGAAGFPGVVALFQQRLWFAGSPGFPDRVWGSQVADYENFATGIADDEAVEYQLAFSGVNTIRWMKALPAGLALGTSAGELTLEGGNENPLTPTNVRARERTFYGSDATLDARRAINLVLFVQRGALRVREFTFSFEMDNYVAPDLTLIAEHLTRPGIIDFDRCASPDSFLFLVTADGQLAAAAYERPENVVAWSHHTTGAEGDGFERVCVIPNPCGTGDEVWVVVRRTIAGEVARYIEVFDGRINVDSGLTYDGPAASVFTGLDHLEGEQIKVVTDDGSVYDLSVVAGAITLPGGAAATHVEAGLHYTSTLLTVRPEFGSATGTAQGLRKHWDHATVRVYCTASQLLFNGETLLERPEGAEPLDDYTGDLARQLNFGWEREGQLILQTLEPKPCTILGITGAVESENP